MKIIQIYHGTKVTKTIQNKSDKIKSLLGQNDSYELILLPKSDNYLVEDPNFKIDLASKTKDLLYIDIDLIINKLPEFTEKGLPYFTSHPEGQSSDLMMFYVNDCCDYFQKILDEREKRKLGGVLWWNRRITRTKLFHNIPESEYDRSKVYDRDLAFLKSQGLR